MTGTQAEGRRQTIHRNDQEAEIITEIDMMTIQDIIGILRMKEIVDTIADQTMITIAILEIGRILIDEMIEIIGTNLSSEIPDQIIVISEEVIPTNMIEIMVAIDTMRLVKGNKLDIMMTVGIKVETTVGTIETIMITVVALSDRINSVHQDPPDKMSNDLQKDRRLTMRIHSGILDGKEWKCRKRPTHW